MSSAAHLAALLFALPATTVAAISSIVAPMVPSHIPAHDDEIADMISAICEPNIGLGVGHGMTMVDINRYYANLVGYRREELIGQPYTMLVAGPIAHDHPRYAVGNLTLRHRYGHLIPVRIVSLPLVTARTDRLVLVRPR